MTPAWRSDAYEPAAAAVPFVALASGIAWELAGTAGFLLRVAHA
jgi:hypothetical protein